MSVRVLIVDDSRTFRDVMRVLLSHDPRLEIVGEAADGLEAVERARILRPDVIAMDVHMPRQDGLSAIRQILSERFTPIVVVTSISGDDKEKVTFQALAAGALEVVAKPSSARGADRFAKEAEAIREALRKVAQVGASPRPPSPGPRPAPALPTRVVQRPQAVGIVASTGGPQALQRVLSALPATFPAPLLIVQHIAEGFERGLADWLGTQCALPVTVAQDGEAPLPGHAYLAPIGTHLVLSRGLLRLQPGPAVRGFCPSGTVLLGSLARELGPAASGVILTGMGEDGVAGLQLIRAASGQTLAQGPESSAVYGMPRVALESGAAERAVELEEVADALLAQLSHTGVPGRRRRLLLVDDSETVLSLERHLLGRDYELFVARDGQEAIDAALRHQPDGILLDYRMPRMTGAAALRWMRATPELSAVPVIMVTSEDSPEILEECRRAGCQTIVPKPIDARRLLAAVSQFVKSQGGSG